MSFHRFGRGRWQFGGQNLETTNGRREIVHVPTWHWDVWSWWLLKIIHYGNKKFSFCSHRSKLFWHEKVHSMTKQNTDSGISWPAVFWDQSQKTRKTNVSPPNFTDVRYPVLFWKYQTDLFSISDTIAFFAVPYDIHPTIPEDTNAVFDMVLVNNGNG